MTNWMVILWGFTKYTALSNSVTGTPVAKRSLPMTHWLSSKSYFMIHLRSYIVCHKGKRIPLKKTVPIQRTLIGYNAKRPSSSVKKVCLKTVHLNTLEPSTLKLTRNKNFRRSLIHYNVKKTVHIGERYKFELRPFILTPKKWFEIWTYKDWFVVPRNCFLLGRFLMGTKVQFLLFFLDK